MYVHTYICKCVHGRDTDRINNGFVISCEGILGITAAMSIDINFIFNSGQDILFLVVIIHISYGAATYVHAS